jgi:hypothetical protein
MTIYSDSIYITEAETFKYKYMKREHKSCEGKMNYQLHLQYIYKPAIILTIMKI